MQTIASNAGPCRHLTSLSYNYLQWNLIIRSQFVRKSLTNSVFSSFVGAMYGAFTIRYLCHTVIALSHVMSCLTHWGRVTHICVGKLTFIGSDNGLSPGRRQAIIWTNAGILLIRPLGTNFSEILIGIQTFSFKKMHLKISSAKWRPFISASMC